MITSVQNEKIKQLRKLHKRKDRTQTGQFLVEGIHLVEEAWKSEWDIAEIIATPEVDIPSWCANFELTEVSEQVFSQLAQTKTPQGIIAVINMKQAVEINGDYILLIDQVQDPGNLGTIIRTADAAGFSGVVLGNGTVDLFNDKVVRATQGSIFHIPIVQRDLIEEVGHLKDAGFEIWATALQDSVLYKEAVVKDKIAIIVGNEGAGVDPQLQTAADVIVKIPIYGQAESLNVSIAAAILMYHVKR